MKTRASAMLLRLRRWLPLMALLSIGAAWTGGVALADDFADVRYDPRTDELVVTMNYRGTNPDHVFALQWGECHDLTAGTGSEMEADVLDSQWNDAARQDYTKTQRFDLSGMACRPAKLTLKTAPRFYFSVQIPARSSTS